jgi:hypothetical protein
MAKLVGAGYLDERKEFVDRKPHTEYAMTPDGRKAYKGYLTAWRSLTKL